MCMVIVANDFRVMAKVIAGDYEGGKLVAGT